MSVKTVFPVMGSHVSAITAGEMTVTKMPTVSLTLPRETLFVNVSQDTLATGGLAWREAASRIINVQPMNNVLHQLEPVVHAYQASNENPTELVSLLVR